MKYRHKIQHMGHSVVGLEAQLDALSAAGWEVVNIIATPTSGHAVLRQPIEEASESVRDPDTNAKQEPQRACPKCGDERHLYQAGADVRWRPEPRRWEHTGDYDLIECTECDWTGTEEETEKKS
jgi:hypothetical protein